MKLSCAKVVLVDRNWGCIFAFDQNPLCHNSNSAVAPDTEKEKRDDHHCLNHGPWDLKADQ